MGQAISLPFKLASTTLTFYRGLYHYLLGPGRTGPYLPPSHPDSTVPSYLRPPPSTSTADDRDVDGTGAASSRAVPSSSSWTVPSFVKTPLFYQHARVHLFTLASEFYLYPRPHYRKSTHGVDLIDNLSNVAVPGTGIPLSMLVRNRPSAFALVTCAYPVISMIASLHLWIKTMGKSSVSDEYAIRLLAPDDWFSYWRLNSRIAAMHALLNDVPPGYDMENKWTFLMEGRGRDVPVSPYLDTPAIVVKHRNEEGGLGIHFYRNATDGGDWIIQERIRNGTWVSDHLPGDAPLSTFRVITQCRGALDVANANGGGCVVDDVTALSCVFRAGRGGAKTDHVSVLFDVDVGTGTVLGGTTNEHWYELGPSRCSLFNPFGGPMWRSDDHAVTHHPDGDIPVSGHVVPDIGGMLRLVEKSHLKLCPDVPLVGWDVVLSADEKLPVCLLEVNLSCNFFRGSFDRRVYLDFLEEMIVNLQGMRLCADREGKKVR
ncbi:hypothetical protein ACHAXA_005839 [Cyclostephanos tholiformis]|uniref:Alpha-L-glutamate ligase-related protein ATP-grasp domain-containing protein n=1 Tax=Cyclostephanos tholiformis TaxID=382380 RepID=A0ABD3RWA7_9STRA